MSTIFASPKVAVRHQHIARCRRRVVIESDSDAFTKWWKMQPSPFRVAVILQDLGDSIEVDLYLISRGAWAGDWKTLEKQFKVTASEDHTGYNLRNCERHTLCCAGDKTGDCTRQDLLIESVCKEIKLEGIDTLMEELQNTYGKNL
jgi:hypothetical protein